MQPLLWWKNNKYYIFWVCAYSLRCSACTAHAPYCHVACPALQYFSTFSHKRRDFRKKVIEHKMCVLIFCTTLSEMFFILRRNERDMIKMSFGLHVKYRLFLWDFNESLIFSTYFQKKYSNIKCNENTSSGSRVFPCGWKEEWTWRSQQSLFEIFRRRLKLLFRNGYIS